jgi:hypothetical protein
VEEGSKANGEAKTINHNPKRVYLGATEFWEGWSRLSGDCFGFIVLAITLGGEFPIWLMSGSIEPMRTFLA